MIYRFGRKSMKDDLTDEALEVCNHSKAKHLGQQTKAVPSSINITTKVHLVLTIFAFIIMRTSAWAEHDSRLINETGLMTIVTTRVEPPQEEKLSAVVVLFLLSSLALTYFQGIGFLSDVY